MPLSRLRLAALLAVTVTAGCGDGFLDPRIAGRWGGENLGINFQKAGATEVVLACGATGNLKGSVNLAYASTFVLTGQVSINAWGPYTFNVRMAGAVYGDSMVVRVFNPDVEGDEPLPITVHRGQDPVFTLFCATGRESE